MSNEWPARGGRGASTGAPRAHEDDAFISFDAAIERLLRALIRDAKLRALLDQRLAEESERER